MKCFYQSKKHVYNVSSSPKLYEFKNSKKKQKLDLITIGLSYEDDYKHFQSFYIFYINNTLNIK